MVKINFYSATSKYPPRVSGQTVYIVEHSKQRTPYVVESEVVAPLLARENVKLIRILEQTPCGRGGPTIAEIDPITESQ